MTDSTNHAYSPSLVYKGLCVVCGHAEPHAYHQPTGDAMTGPAVIDLEALKAKRINTLTGYTGRKTPLDAWYNIHGDDIDALIAAVEALRERVAEAELNEDALGAIRKLLKEHGVPTAAFIDDHVAGAIVQRNEAVARAEASEAQTVELAGALQGVEEYFDQRADAEYLPGQAAPVGNEEMEFLTLVHAALATLPADVLERAKVRQDIIDIAREIVSTESAWTSYWVAKDRALKNAFANLDALDMKHRGERAQEFFGEPEGMSTHEQSDAQEDAGT
jgi:hypothetical protein